MHKQRVVTHACNPSTREVEVGESGVQGHPLLRSELQATLDYAEPRFLSNTEN